MKNSVNAAVIGAGRMGQYHVSVYSEMADVKLVGVVDVDEERGRKLAARYHTDFFTDYRELFGRADVVSIAAPTPWHFEITRDCLNADIHCLVEKPICNRLEDAQELFRIAEERNIALHIGHVERYNGAVQELHKVVHNPIFLESRRMGPFDPRIKDDGVVLDLMIHDLDIVLNLVDSPVTNFNVVGSSVFSNAEDVVNVQLQFENGALASILASRATQEKIRTLAITQETEYIFLDYTSQDILVHRRASSQHELSRTELKYRQEALIERIFVHRDNPLKLELRHLLDCATDPLKRKKDAEKELRSLRVALQILEKMETVRRQLVVA